jgi:hypothetical protein
MVTSSIIADTFFSNIDKVYGNNNHCEAEVDSMVYIFLCGLGIGRGTSLLKQQYAFNALIRDKMIQTQANVIGKCRVRY